MTLIRSITSRTHSASRTFSGNGAPSGNFEFQITLLPGDADRDNEVGLLDFDILQSNFGNQGATWADGDFDGDGEVGLQDFDLLQNNFGTNYKNWP